MHSCRTCDPPGWRALGTTPVATVLIVASLALGIGANTAIFSIVNSLMLRPLPVADPERLVVLADNDDPVPFWSYPVWQQVREHGDIASGAAAWAIDRLSTTSRGPRDYVQVLFVSGSFFESRGVRPLAGRLLNADDERAADGPAAVISHRYYTGRSPSRV
jgi:hypothetical protein